MQQFSVFLAIIFTVGLISLALGWFSGRASGFTKALRVLERQRTAASAQSTYQVTESGSATYREAIDVQPTATPVVEEHFRLHPARSATSHYLDTTLPPEEDKDEDSSRTLHGKPDTTVPWLADLQRLLALEEALHTHYNAMQQCLTTTEHGNTETRNRLSAETATTEELAYTTATLQQVVKQMKEAAEQADEIHQVGKSAEMLALNAAIEAARAGEAGRGFSVVAANMKTLAHTSQEAADNIRTLLAQTGQQIDQLTAHLNDDHALERVELDQSDRLGDDVTEESTHQASQANLLAQARELGFVVESVLRSLRDVRHKVEDTARSADA